jgi:FkbM family methyltransferase
MRVWIDVGAHIGQSSFAEAQKDPKLMVFAFEPLLPQAAQTFAKLPNYMIIPMAVSLLDGFVEFYVNSYEQASSILPLHKDGLAQWRGGEAIGDQFKVLVPCISLQSFFGLMRIEHCEFLKVDAQGFDLNVVKSLGKYTDRVDKIQMEVAITDVPLYHRADTKKDILDYMSQNGFRLTATHRQTHNQEENLTFERITG